MKNDMKCILITRDEIAKRVQELGREISDDYKGELPLLLCILKGSVVFYADLVRDLP